MVRHGIDTLVGDLRDVQQAVAVGDQVHKGAKLGDLDHRTLIDSPNLNLGGNLGDALFGQFARFGAGGSNLHRAVVRQLDLATGLLGQGPDHRPTLANHIADLVRIDLEGDDTRRVLAHLVRLLFGTIHDVQDMQAAFACLM